LHILCLKVFLSHHISPPIPCIYAERHLHQMMEEKRREDLQFKLYRFRARSVPLSTYRQPNFDWKSKDQRFRTRSLPSRSLTSAAYSSPDFALNERKANLHTRSPPLSTYLRPSSCSQSVEELRALKAQRRSVQLLSKARGPIGVEVNLRKIYSHTSLIKYTLIAEKFVSYNELCPK